MIFGIITVYQIASQKISSNFSSTQTIHDTSSTMSSEKNFSLFVWLDFNISKATEAKFHLR